MSKKDHITCPICLHHFTLPEIEGWNEEEQKEKGPVFVDHIEYPKEIPYGVPPNTFWAYISSTYLDGIGHEGAVKEIFLRIWLSTKA